MNDRPDQTAKHPAPCPNITVERAQSIATDLTGRLADHVWRLVVGDERTVAEVADEAGIDPGRVDCLLGGQVPFEMGELFNLAHVLGVPTSSIFEAAETDRGVYDCPWWCVRWDHSSNEQGQGGHIHYAANIGTCGPQQQGDDLSVVIDLGLDLVTVKDEQQLRQIAADMVKAADWMARVRTASQQ